MGEIAPVGIVAAVESAERYARAEKSEATRRAYRSDARHYAAWCEGVGVAAIPALPATAAAYLASLADGGKSVSTIERRAAAIAYAHRLGGHPSPLANEAVKAVLRGIRRERGAAKKGKRPATAELIAAFARRSPKTLAGKRDRALLLLGFAAALRRSEIAALRVEDIERTGEGVFVRVQRSKTDQEGRGAEIAIPAGGKLGVLAALDEWLAAAALKDGALFRAVDRHGRISARGLSGRAVGEIVKRAARRAKVDPREFGGHSLRAGFVTSALKRGADLFRIMDVTRHREVKTLRVYDRRAKAFDDHPGKDFL